MAMKIGVNAWVWQSPFTNEHFHLIDKAKAMGFDSFELGLEEPSHIDGQKLHDKLKQVGMGVVICGAFGPSRDLTNEDPKFRQESLDYIAQSLKICEKAGSKVLAGPMYSAVGKRRHVSPDQKKQEWDLAVQGIRKASKMASDHGVKIALEPLNRFETDLINTAEQLDKLLNDIGEKNVGAHLDTFHMNIEETDSGAAIRLAGQRLFHFHACENNRSAPGSGRNIDWEGVAKALKDVKYEGHAVIETFTPDCKSIAAAAAIWRPLAKTQDGLASEGLAFLRKTLV